MTTDTTDMTAPTKHTDRFTDRDEAPPMAALEEGDRIKVRYKTTRGDGGQKNIRGTILSASPGRSFDTIIFEPDHADNRWRLRLNSTGATLEYHASGPGQDWRHLDISGGSSIIAQLL